jgi:hypothetical protein
VAKKRAILATFQRPIFAFGKPLSSANRTLSTANVRLTKEWYARVQFQGKRQFFPLGTPNKAAAAAKARDIYLLLTVNGWALTLAKHKPKSRSTPATGATITLGSFLDAVFAVTTDRPLIEFRRVTRETEKVRHDFPKSRCLILIAPAGPDG